jgi:hypothetical protein
MEMNDTIGYIKDQISRLKDNHSSRKSGRSYEDEVKYLRGQMVDVQNVIPPGTPSTNS